MYHILHRSPLVSKADWQHLTSNPASPGHQMLEYQGVNRVNGLRTVTTSELDLTLEDYVLGFHFTWHAGLAAQLQCLVERLDKHPIQDEVGDFEPMKWILPLVKLGGGSGTGDSERNFWTLDYTKDFYEAFTASFDGCRRVIFDPALFPGESAGVGPATWTGRCDVFDLDLQIRCFSFAVERHVEKMTELTSGSTSQPEKPSDDPWDEWPLMDAKASSPDLS